MSMFALQFNCLFHLIDSYWKQTVELVEQTAEIQVTRLRSLRVPNPLHWVLGPTFHNGGVCPSEYKTCNKINLVENIAV